MGNAMDNDYAYKVYGDGTLKWEIFDRQIAINKGDSLKDKYTNVSVSYNGRTIAKWENGKKV